MAIPSDARNIDLTPKAATTQSGQAQTFVATVIDGRGQPVFNVPVTVTRVGSGRFP